MHELSIAISMIDQISEESANRGGLDVQAVHMRLGVFAGVDKNALLFAYSLACEGTPLQGSRLVIETVPLLVYCPVCRHECTPPSVYQIYCPECFTPTPEILTGREMEVALLEVAV
ncbi:MAG: hydrogenase expression/synthesis HypA [Edaphobacter sp.]|jgi:hydrogenase nickel incorporation protein HypA/HybF|nr:hydrogenase expression/synthesis HypA [Edaphobacter sp.]